MASSAISSTNVTCPAAALAGGHQCPTFSCLPDQQFPVTLHSPSPSSSPVSLQHSSYGGRIAYSGLPWLLAPRRSLGTTRCAGCDAGNPSPIVFLRRRENHQENGRQMPRFVRELPPVARLHGCPLGWPGKPCCGKPNEKLHGVFSACFRQLLRRCFMLEATSTTNYPGIVAHQLAGGPRFCTCGQGILATLTWLVVQRYG